ncbi:MAG TPA: isoleucine--tRNA ligase [Candidatus Fermentibacter daniensis]|nr:isoleucine--tRNA ligase [Candidatus Fermentibacter daniensis]HOR06329.1 isoleucine--tRNA ligase [Candidatus Fermentibacter daniensis]HPK51933.1 isoleucine--tRNA ligase [Candidatus Fermentibacter daniensis]
MKESSYKDTIRLPSTGFAMKADLPAREPGMLASWREQDIYSRIRESRKGREVFILHDGPPYANGSVHLGTALNKILKDFVVKSYTMLGYDCPFVPGWDCHGMPIEHRVTSGLSGRTEAPGRSEIRAMCREYAARHVDIQREEFSRLGVFGDWANPYLTMSRSYEAGILRAFGDLVELGYIYQGLRPISWCSTCRTALADAEVEYSQKKSPSIWVAFEQDSPDEWQARGVPNGTEVVIWTTTPWTLPANRAVALNPAEEYVIVEAGDRRFLVASRRSGDFISAVPGMGGIPGGGAPKFRGSDLEGLGLKHPLTPGLVSRVITAEHVTMDDGTGCVHTAPGHGTEDFAAGMRYGLEAFSPVDEAGVFTADAGRYAGMEVHDSDPVIIEDLKASGRLLHSSVIEHSYQHCWRCHKPLIYRATSQFFLDLSKNDLKDRVLASVDSIGWHPDWGYERMKNMMSARPDWCLSRQRVWGVALPVLKCRDCSRAFLDAKMARAVADIVEEKGSDAWFEMAPSEIGALAGRPAVCECGSGDFDRVDDILDVWFDSSLSHRNVLSDEFGLSRPASVYLEATDQHRGWFGVSLITSTALDMGIPTRNVITHGLILDGQGKKMSKSLGNVISPSEIIDSFGADILRLWFSSVDYTADFRADRSMLDDTREAYRKLRNTIRFLLGNLSGDERREDFTPSFFTGLERFMYLRFRQASSECLDAYRSFQFHRVFRELRNLATIELSGLFLDARKDRLYCDDPAGEGPRATRMLLGWMAAGFLKLIAPIIPFTAEEGWRELPPGLSECPSVHAALLEDLPLSQEEEAELRSWDRFLDIRRAALKNLEEARAGGIIGSSLEAHVLLGLPQDALESANGECWEDFLIVSTVETSVSPSGETTVQVIRTPHEKCGRCWKHLPEVASDESHLCARCRGVVGGSAGGAHG